MIQQVVSHRYQFKRGTEKSWKEANPILREGEPGFELDTGLLKIGDGSGHWNDLKYINHEVYVISPDNKTLALDIDGKMTIYGFDSASANYIPMKNEKNELIWIELKPVAFTGKIEDLSQEKTIIFYGGSATDLVEGL